MAKLKLIEMVCTGNQGRSPVAELLANNYIVKIGAHREYFTISSGTQVDNIARGATSLPLMRQVLGTGIYRGMYGDEMYLVRDALDRGDTTTLKPYFDRTVDTFRTEELAHRDKVLLELGVQGRVKQCKDQTVIRQDVVLILPVDKKNKDAVVKIYQPKDVKPTIEVLSAYATANPDAEITNTFGRGEEFYRATVMRMMTEVPQAIDKLLRSA